MDEKQVFRGSGIGDQGPGIRLGVSRVTYCVLRIAYYASRITHHVSRFAPHARLVKSALLLAIALWLAFGSLVPAIADGPLLPGYIIRDGEPVPAPAGYVQAGVISGEGQECGPFAAPKDLLLDPATGNLLVVDTGNNRVVILSISSEYLSEIGDQGAGLNAPEGVYVDVNGDIWVADTGNERVAVFAPDGTFLAEYHKPESDLIEEYGFRPIKIVIDKRGFIYTVVGSEGNLGIVVMDSTERFRGFFGRTRVKFNLARVLARLVASKAQRLEYSSHLCFNRFSITPTPK